MPIYEYQCLACGHQFEVMQDVNEKPPSSCPECKKRRIKKQVSATHFQLKGTGWYVTDFKNPPKKPLSEAQEQDSKGSKADTDTVAKDKSESTSKGDKENKGKNVKSNKNESSGEKGKKSKE
jgi:putative FmdB family regulatory protein